jgi:hypothetical protein
MEKPSVGGDPLGTISHPGGNGEIPTESIIVETESRTYRFGPLEKDGKRTVARDGKTLPFTRCELTVLEEGEAMELIPVGYGSGLPWGTTAVELITTAE